MWICPSCTTKNLNENALCEKCGASKEFKVFCAECGKELSQSAKVCDACGGAIRVELKKVKIKDGADHSMEFLIGIIIPFVGIIMGILYIAQKESIGRALLISSIVALLIEGGLLYFFVLAPLMGSNFY